MNNSKIKAVIFDMDGVLVDNRDVHIAAFQKWCSLNQVSTTREQLLPLFGMGNAEIFAQVLQRPLTPKLIDQFAREKETIYRDMFEQQIAPVAGLVELLKKLHAMGIKMAVGSSGPQKNVDFVLSKCGITQYFDTIANGDMLTHAKPNPEVFLLAASMLGVPPEQCVVCEDSFAGVQAARSAGMKVVALATTFARNEHTDYDMLISDFREITAQQIVNL
ncbi:MAG: HAD family phosphatase [Mucinivorans sp.]